MRDWIAFFLGEEPEEAEDPLKLPGGREGGGHRPAPAQAEAGTAAGQGEAEEAAGQAEERADLPAQALAQRLKPALLPEEQRTQEPEAGAEEAASALRIPMDGRQAEAGQEGADALLLPQALRQAGPGLETPQGTQPPGAGGSEAGAVQIPLESAARGGQLFRRDGDGADNSLTMVQKLAQGSRMDWLYGPAARGMEPEGAQGAQGESLLPAALDRAVELEARRYDRAMEIF